MGNEADFLRRPLLLSQALEAKRPGYLEPNAVAHVFVALGDHERALMWLDCAVEERAPHVAEMAVEPALDPLRPDPRFVRLLKRVGLPMIPSPFVNSVRPGLKESAKSLKRPPSGYRRQADDGLARGRELQRMNRGHLLQNEVQ